MKSIIIEFCNKIRRELITVFVSKGSSYLNLNFKETLSAMSQRIMPMGGNSRLQACLEFFKKRR